MLISAPVSSLLCLHNVHFQGNFGFPDEQNTLFLPQECLLMESIVFVPFLQPLVFVKLVAAIMCCTFWLLWRNRMKSTDRILLL